MGIVASSRIINLLDDKEHVADNGTQRPDEIRGEVSFEKVWFAYNDANYVLKDINLLIRPGEAL